LNGRRAAIFEAYGAHPSFKSADVLSPHLNIAFTTEALCGPVANVELVGPSFPLLKRGDEVLFQPLPTDRPIVYASFGSQIYHWPEIFAKLRRLNVHLVLSVGELFGQIEADQNCQIYRYAPQQAILERADVFITHGGANSFMEAIAAGVPMLLSPMCNDQFHQAYFTERSGIGLVTDLRTITDTELAAAVEILLADGPHRTAMKAMSQSYAVNGALRAAELIERLRV
jgi:MGT family glycosyltransferase